MTGVTIRRAVPGDLAAVAALLEAADSVHRDALPWLFQRVDARSIAESLEPYVTKTDHAMYVAIADDSTVAGVAYMYLRAPSRAPIVIRSTVAELDALVVSLTFRRQGIATRLVHSAREWAHHAGADRIELNVYDFNESARLFWESVGFRTLSRRLVLNSLPAD